MTPQTASASPTIMFRCKLFSDNLGSGRLLLVVDHMQCETVKSQTFMKKRGMVEQQAKAQCRKTADSECWCKDSNHFSRYWIAISVSEYFRLNSSSFVVYNVEISTQFTIALNQSIALFQSQNKALPARKSTNLPPAMLSSLSTFPPPFFAPQGKVFRDETCHKSHSLLMIQINLVGNIIRL